MTEKLEARGWLVKAEKGSFVVVATSSFLAMDLARNLGIAKYGEIFLVEEIAEAVFVTELTEPETVDGVGKDVLQLYELQVP